MKKKAIKKRGEKYEPKLTLKENVAWDDLISVAIQGNNKGMKSSPKKSKAKKKQ